MANISSLTVRRVPADNRPAHVRAVMESGDTFNFDVAPELSEKRIATLVGHLIDFENRGEQVMRRRNRQ